MDSRIRLRTGGSPTRNEQSRRRLWRCPDPCDVTGRLRAWGQGDERALQQLVSLEYEQLRASAHRYMARERPGTRSRPPR